MKRKRFTEEQIVAVLREHEAGMKTGDLVRRNGISEATLYNSKARFGGMDLSDNKRLRALEKENGKLRALVAQNGAVLTPVELEGLARTEDQRKESATTRDLLLALALGAPIPSEGRNPVARAGEGLGKKIPSLTTPQNKMPVAQ